MSVTPTNEDSIEADVKAENLVKELTLEEKFLLLANHNDSVYLKLLHNSRPFDSVSNRVRLDSSALS